MGDEAIGNAGTGFGVHGGGSFGLGTGPLAIKADASWESRGAGESDESFQMLGVSADLVFNFGGEGKVKPYLLAGGGCAQLGASDDSFDATSTFAFNGGAGPNFALGSLGAFVEARYVMAPFTISGVDFDADNIPIVVGPRFWT